MLHTLPRCVLPLAGLVPFRILDAPIACRTLASNAHCAGAVQNISMARVIACSPQHCISIPVFDSLLTRARRSRTFRAAGRNCSVAGRSCACFHRCRDVCLIAIMPPAKKPRWSQPRRSSASKPSGGEHELVQWHESEQETSVVPRTPSISAVERRQIYARLLWLDDYRLVFAAEAALHAPLLGSLMETYVSAHTRRLMHSDTPEGARALQAVEQRLRDCVGFLERSRSRLHVPIGQASKAIAYLASGVAKPVWEAERKARRVVGREYAMDLLNEMAHCRPPPPFEEQSRKIICSIGFDQTYAKAGAGTGGSKYNALQTVDANGEPTNVERMVYINGQYLPVPLASTALSPAALTLIAAVGPYTQDFRRVLPLLQPRRLDGVMDGLVRRASGLLAGQVPASTQVAMARLLSRPNDNPGRATYLTFMPPLFFTNTQSYIDMIKIVCWCVSFIGCTPLVLHLIGDGQSVLRLRDLKRLHPDRYKHVLIGNGHFHSGAHSSFADVTLWWYLV